MFRSGVCAASLVEPGERSGAGVRRTGPSDPPVPGRVASWLSVVRLNRVSADRARERREPVTVRDSRTLPLMSKRNLNIVLCVVFLALLLALPIRNLLFTEAPPGARGEGFRLASYVMLFLFSSLTLVFGFRAARGGPTRGG